MRRMTPTISLYAAGALLAAAVAVAGCRSSRAVVSDATSGSSETIVMMRHGEKAEGGLGQLDCTGLDRSLALPRMLIRRFGKANAIFAPNPSVQVRESSFSNTQYSYVRALATIEPTAIALGLPVETQIGFRDIRDLQSAVTAPAYANSTVFIAWEHKYAHDFAQQMLHSYGLNASQVPEWRSDDFETLYVFHITQPAGKSAPTMTFTIEQEGLSPSLSNTCPLQ